MKKNFGSFLAPMVAMALVLGTDSAQAAIVAIDNTGVIQNQSGSPGYTLGNEFATGAAGIDVTAIGAYASGGAVGGGTSLSQVPVAIYSYSSSGNTWTLVTGTQVTFNGNGSSYTYQNGSYFQTISTVQLAGNTTYAVIAANYVVNADWNYGTANGSGGPTFNSGSGLISLPSGNPIDPATSSGFFIAGATLQSSYIASSGGLAYENTATPYWGAGTFEFTAVPEPVNVALALFGVVAVGGIAGRRWLASRKNALQPVSAGS
jgi:hypothetical protein